MKLYVVGIGPGNFDGMTIQAKKAIEKSSLIVGYKVYTELVKPFFPEKEFYSTGMRSERERVLYALEKASCGISTALICSGDSAVYGMAGLAIELSEGFPDVDVEAVAGVTSALSGGANLGAPLTHDFAVISLSDLLTPMEKIIKRLECAAMADFTIVLYNPSSVKRRDYLRKACDIVLKHRRPDTVCGIARNTGREGEETKILTLMELRDTETDMFSTVFIGNSETKIVRGQMVTPRGYRSE